MVQVGLEQGLLAAGDRGSHGAEHFVLGVLAHSALRSSCPRTATIVRAMRNDTGFRNLVLGCLVQVGKDKNLDAVGPQFVCPADMISWR